MHRQCSAFFTNLNSCCARDAAAQQGRGHPARVRSGTAREAAPPDRRIAPVVRKWGGFSSVNFSRAFIIGITSTPLRGSQKARRHWLWAFCQRATARTAARPSSVRGK